MAMDDTESCSSRAVDIFTTQTWKQKQKVDVYDEVLCRLRQSHEAETSIPGFKDELWAHCHRLPTSEKLLVKELEVCFVPPIEQIADLITKPLLITQFSALRGKINCKRYATDVNVERAQDVLMHKTLLCMAHDPPTRLAIDVRLVQDFRQLRNVLAEEISKFQKMHPLLTPLSTYPIWKQDKTRVKCITNCVNIPSDEADIWEIDTTLIIYDKKIASGSFSDLYKGTFYGEDVAIKLLKDENLNENIRREFAQEVYIMRKIRHKNVVRFVGACTRPPGLSIITEYMSGGSIHDFLHTQKGVLNLPSLLRVAVDVSKGMYYLHQKNIIHRDLKAANLLMDGDGVIEQKPYNHRPDIYSFGIVLWGLLTVQLPYENLTPLQAAVGMVQKGLRPTIPRHAHLMITSLLEKCWHQDPSLRPEFSKIVQLLQHMLKEV